MRNLLSSLSVLAAFTLAAGCSTTSNKPASTEPAADLPQAHAPMTAASKVPEDAVGNKASAEMKDQQGNTVGTVELEQAANGVVMKIHLKGATAGERAFHIHEVGKCEAPFTSAGGHYNPRQHQHGIHNPEGKHAGDLPNLHIPESGELQVQVFTDSVHLGEGEGSVFDADGSSLMIHEGVDDYRSDPTGNAGGRWACGVIKKG